MDNYACNLWIKVFPPRKRFGKPPVSPRGAQRVPRGGFRVSSPTEETPSGKTLPGLRKNPPEGFPGRKTPSANGAAAKRRQHTPVHSEAVPAKSRKQQRYLHAKFGHAWAKRHHFDKIRRRKKAAK